MIRYLREQANDGRGRYRVELGVRVRDYSHRTWTTIGIIERSVDATNDGIEHAEVWHVRLRTRDGRSAGSTAARSLTAAKAWVEKLVLKAYGDYASAVADHLEEGGTPR